MKKVISAALRMLATRATRQNTLYLLAGFFLCYEGVQAQTAPFGGGSGTGVDPYLIRTLEHLNAIRNNSGGENYLDDTFRLTTDLDFSDVDGNGTDYVYSPDADENNKGWKPLGDSSSPFIGSFDGDDHVIHNLFIDRAGEHLIGLFGKIGGNRGVHSGGKIKGLGLENVNIKGNDEVGGLVGWSEHGMVIDSYTTGIVSGARLYAGGLVGRVSREGTVIGSYATSVVKGNIGVGGLVGWVIQGSRVTDSYATGAVNGSRNVGGLVGGGSSVTDSYATGAVSGSSHVGGLVGRATQGGPVTGSYATGTVRGSGNNVGGLVGHTSAGATMSNCYATGAVSGDERVGGLLGLGISTSISNCYSTGVPAGTAFVGGFVGTISGGRLENCYWNMQISGQSTSGGGTGLTTAEMYGQGNFVGWDFTSTWHAPNAAKGLFPLLRGVGLRPSDVPLLAVLSLSISNAEATEATLTVRSDKTGTLHYGVLGRTSVVPGSLADIRGLKAAGRHTLPTANTAVSVMLMGLEASTTYTAYAVLADEAMLLSAISSSAAFTTADAPTPTPAPNPNPPAITGVEGETIQDLLLFPNPVADALGIAGANKYTRIAVYDLQGRLVHSQTAGARVDFSVDFSVDFRHVRAGAYLVKIYTANSLRSVRILKR